MEKEDRDIILNAEEDGKVVPQMSLVEDIIRTPSIQVVTGLISKKYNVITTIKLAIMHMNAGRNSMTKEGKSKTSEATPTLHQAQC